MHPIDAMGGPAIALVALLVVLWVGQAMVRAWRDVARTGRARRQRAKALLGTAERRFHWHDEPYTWPDPHAKWVWGANAQVPLPTPYRCSNCGADIQPGEVLMRWPMFDATYHQWADDPQLPCGPVYPVAATG